MEKISDKCFLKSQLCFFFFPPFCGFDLLTVALMTLSSISHQLDTKLLLAMSMWLFAFCRSEVDRPGAGATAL